MLNGRSIHVRIFTKASHNTHTPHAHLNADGMKNKKREIHLRYDIVAHWLVDMLHACRLIYTTQVRTKHNRKAHMAAGYIEGAPMALSRYRHFRARPRRAARANTSRQPRPLLRRWRRHGRRTVDQVGDAERQLAATRLWLSRIRSGRPSGGWGWIWASS